MNYFRLIYKRTGPVTLNTLANLSGNLWSSFLSLLTIPIYIRLLGAEAYGLIGFFGTFDILFNLLDLGLSTTINREIARVLATHEDPAKNKVTLRTYEIIYWGIGVGITLILLACAGWFATKWVNVSTLSTSDVRISLIVISFAFMARWPVSLYTGVLRGLQAQVFQNIVLIITSTFRILGGIIAINLIAPTIHVYVIWYAAASALEIILIYFAAWYQLNRLAPGAHAFFDFVIVKNTWKFALSFNLVGVIGSFVASADRIVISKMLPLKQLGYYSVALSAANVLHFLSYAMMIALFPRFVGHTFGKDASGLLKSFRQAFGMLSFLSVGMAFGLVFYARELLFIWTKAPDVVSNAYYPVVFLTLANMANAIFNVPYTLLIAQGQTRVLLMTNLVSTVIYVPLLPITIPVYGMNGCAFLFFLLNCILLLFYLYLVNQRLFHGGLIKVLYINILIYVMLGLACIGLPHLFVDNRSALLVMSLSGMFYFVAGFMLYKYLSAHPKDLITEAA